MARLGIKIEQVALLRELGRSVEPDPVHAAIYAELGGADGIVCPLKEGLRPLTQRDAELLKEMVKTHLTLQISPSEKMISFALSIAPDMITFVPGKKPGTTEGGGLDVLGHTQELARVVGEIRSKDLVVSILVDPNVHQVKAASKIGVDYVELHLGKYAMAGDLNERADLLEEIRTVALIASKLELGVSVSQGLDYRNIIDVASIECIEEVNVGHSVISRGLWMGMEQAVRDMATLVH